MGQPIPQQHPAVVLRSHYRHVQTMLVIALVAVVALAATVVALATDSDGTSSARSPQTAPARHGDSMSSQMAARRSAIHGKGSPMVRFKWGAR
jgi:hypothetical protein